MRNWRRQRDGYLRNGRFVSHWLLAGAGLNASHADGITDMDLRKELLPPPLDESLVRQLAELAEQLDGCRSDRQNCRELLRQFHQLTGLSLTLRDFHFSGAISADSFVREMVTAPPQRDKEITDDELLEIIRRIIEADGSEHQLNYWLELLAVNIPNRQISDLIYWPGEYFGDGDHSRELAPKEILDLARQQRRPPILLPSAGEA